MKRYALIVIIILAAILRLYRLPDVPPGVNRDEASIGFTANSLLRTGNDEYGRRFPLSFESFGDWKLPLYIYSTIPFVRIFGVSELAVRLPSALSGIATVAVLFYLTKILFASENAALLSAFILAVMPWHIHISRVESEAIVAVLLVTLGSLKFMEAIRELSTEKLILSAALLGATFYTYHGNHVFTSLFVIGLGIIYRKDIYRIPRWRTAFWIGAIMVSLILFITFSADHTKISGISIFGDPTVIHTKIEMPRLQHDNPDSISARLLHNRATYALITIFDNYLKSYGPEFLFINGGGNRAHNISGYGNLHPLEAPFLLLGIAYLIGFIRRKEMKFILWWIAIAAVAAAITKDAPHSNRMLSVVPALAVAIALGIRSVYAMIPKKLAPVFLMLLMVCYAASLTYYLDLYLDHFPKTEAASWGYAYRKLSVVLTADTLSDKRVIMSHPEKSPYIYLLFYTTYDPAAYQKEAKRYPISRDGFTDVSGYGRFTFRAIDWKHDPYLPNTLIVTDTAEMPEALAPKRIAVIDLPDKTGMFSVLDTDR